MRPMQMFIFNVIPIDYHFYKHTALNHELLPMNSNFYIFGFKSKMLLFNIITVIVMIGILILLFCFIKIQIKFKLFQKKAFAEQ